MASLRRELINSHDFIIATWVCRLLQLPPLTSKFQSKLLLIITATALWDASEIPENPCPQGQEGMNKINGLSHLSVGEDREQGLNKVNGFSHVLCLSLVLVCKSLIYQTASLFNRKVLSKWKGWSIVILLSSLTTTSLLYFVCKSHPKLSHTLHPHMWLISKCTWTPSSPIPVPALSRPLANKQSQLLNT